MEHLPQRPKTATPQTLPDSCAPRVDVADWDGSLYEIPTIAVLAAAVVWEYARELEPVCKLVSSLRTKFSDAQYSELCSITYPMNVHALLDDPEFPTKPFYNSQAYKTPFCTFLDLPDFSAQMKSPPKDPKMNTSINVKSEGPLNPPATARTPPPHAQFHVRDAGWDHLENRRRVWAENSGRKPINFGFRTCLTGTLTPKSFKVDGFCQPQNPEECWLFIFAHRPQVQHIIDEESLHNYVISFSSESGGNKVDALIAEHDVIISKAWLGADGSRIEIPDNEVHLSGDYGLWTLPWDDAVRRAKNGELWSDLDMARSNVGTAAVQWTRKELTNALLSLFSLRLSRYNIKLIEDDNDYFDLFVKSGSDERIRAHQMPLSPVKGCGRTVLGHANEALPTAKRLFPSLKKLELITAKSKVLIKNNGNPLTL